MREFVAINIRSEFVSFFNVANYIKAVLNMILEQIFQYIFFHVCFLLITFSCDYWELWHVLYKFKHTIFSTLDILDLLLSNYKFARFGLLHFPRKLF